MKPEFHLIASYKRLHSKRKVECPSWPQLIRSEKKHKWSVLPYVMKKLKGGGIRITGKSPNGSDEIWNSQNQKSYLVKHRAAGKEVLNWLRTPTKEYHVCREGIYWQERVLNSIENKRINGGILNRCRQRSEFYTGCWSYGRDSVAKGDYIYFINDSESLCYFDGRELQPKPFILSSEVQAFTIGNTYMHTLSKKGRLQKWLLVTPISTTLKSTLVLRRTLYGEEILLTLNHSSLISRKTFTTLQVRSLTKLAAALEVSHDSCDTDMTFYSISADMNTYTDRSLTCSNPVVGHACRPVAAMHLVIVDCCKAVALMTSDYAAVLTLSSYRLTGASLIRVTDSSLLIFSCLLVDSDRVMLVSGYSKPDIYCISAIDIPY